MNKKAEIVYRIQQDTARKVVNLDEVPAKVRLVHQEILDLTGKKRNQLLVPQRYCNLYAEVRGEEVLVEFDEAGKSYSRFIPTLRPDIVVNIHYDGEPESFSETLDALEVATDFCDTCGHPLKKHSYSQLTQEWDPVADMYYCKKCASYSLRFYHDSLRWFTALQSLIRKHEPQMEKDYVQRQVKSKRAWRVLSASDKKWTTPQQRLGRRG